MLRRQHRFSILGSIVFIAACAASSTGKAPQLSTQIEELRSQREAFGTHYMVSTQGVHSTAAGLEMFRLGGNAIDAATAISFAISVERCRSTGLGGGGFMLINSNKDGEAKVQAFDFREQAPRLANKNMYLDKQGNVVKGLSTDGILAVGVPGLVAGVLMVHEKYGKLTRAQVMAPAIRLAEAGFAVTKELNEAIVDRLEVIKKYPATAAIFLKANGEPYQVGDLFIQADLAKTLRAIATNGRDGFYKGWVAQALVRQSQQLHGLLSQADLNMYTVKERPPIHTTYKGFEIYSMPPPSSGGVHVAEILNILEPLPLKNYGVMDARTVHLTAAAMQRAFADRAVYLGDSDFVDVPIHGLLSKKYAGDLRKGLLAWHATPSSTVQAGQPRGHESDETTHFTVMDSDGNTVSSTQTINGWLGSGVVAAGTGVLLNNEMDDFSAKPGSTNLYGALGGDANAVASGKRPLSSMSPTIVMQGKRPILALGSPSGTRIISCVTLTMLNYLEHQLPLYESVALPRYHHQWQPDEIRVDSPSFPRNTQEKLQKMGYTINNKDLSCRVAAVAYEMQGNTWRLHGVADPRGEGLAQGE